MPTPDGSGVRATSDEGPCGLPVGFCGDDEDCDLPPCMARAELLAENERLRREVFTLANSEGLAVVTAETERDQLRERLKEYEQLFDIQQTRMQRATDLWRAESPAERALVSPDLGRLLDWLIERGDTATHA